MPVYNLSLKQIGYVKMMVTEASKRGLPRLAAVYAVACSGAEASLMNWENNGTSTHVGRAEGRQLNYAERVVARQSRGLGDGVPSWGDNLDSMGLFAQRPMSGWGTPAQIMRPTYSINAFFDELVKVKDWETLPAAKVIKKVQGYHSDVYTDWLATAEKYVPNVMSTNSEKDWYTMATETDLRNIVTNVVSQLKDQIVQAVHDDLVSTLRAGEFDLVRNSLDARIHAIVVGVIRDMKANGEFRVSSD